MVGNVLQVAPLRWVVRGMWAVRNWYGEIGRQSEREARGQNLLKEWLSSEQLEQYEAEKHFDVIGCHSGKRYRIRLGRVSNIHELDDRGRPKIGWCFIPVDCPIVGDVMLAQKIALETDEIGALRVARQFAVRWSAQ